MPEKDIPYGVGVLVVIDGGILCGIRGDNFQICGPGGHIQIEETPIQAAVRETEEEFGIHPNELSLLGVASGSDDYMPAFVYLCTKYSGEIKVDGTEMLGWSVGDFDQVMKQHHIHPAFKASLELMGEKFGISRSDGWPGSGNWGHAGRPGEVGGSTSGGGMAFREKIGDTYISLTNKKSQQMKLEKAINGVAHSSMKSGEKI